MIIPLYKRLGASTHQLAATMGQRLGEKATHTGTLDPMAEGVVVVLSGQDRFKKTQVANFQKEYQVELLIGVTTDSDDLLGLVSNVNSHITTQHTEHILSALQHMPSQINLPIHRFSAKRTKGSSYFELSKQNINFEPVSETMHVHAVQLKKQDSIDAVSLLHHIKEKISVVEGDFRQKEILDSWQNHLLQLNEAKDFMIISFTLTCAKRTYVRSIARHLSEITQVPLTLFSLIRTRNGPFTTEDCLCLI